MKKIYSFFASLTAVVMLAGIMSFLRVNAAAATVLPTDSDAPRSGCTFLGIEGKYIAQIQEAIDRINEIRLEACREGVENPSSKGNPLTTADYIPIKWSADLEYIARLRAAEASVTMDHKRLNGESIWGITGPNGVRSYGEVIAWNWSETMTQGIDQWYGEKSDWVNKTGGVTGHYTQMIDPEHRYVGLGTFCSKSVKYYNTTAGEFSGDLKNPDTSRGKSTGNIIQTLEVKNDLISYEISGSDTLSVSAAITTTDYWSKPLKTEGLTIIGASANNVQWSSSNNDIVSVSNGKVTVKKCGSAVITAKMPDGSSLTKTFSSQHSYKTTTTAATCKSEGKITETCTVCGDTKTKTIPKTNKHSYKTASTTAATCKEGGKTVEKCTVCGDTKTTTTPKTNKHSFGKWVTAKAPTASSDGLEKRTCSVCGTEETRTLKYEGSNTSSNANNSSGDSSSSTTSDDNSSLTSSEDNSSSTTSEDNSSSTSSSGNSSTVSSNVDSSAPLSSDGSSEPSSGDEVQSEAASDSSEVADTSNDTDSGNSNKMLPFLIAGGGVLVAGAIGFVIFLLIKRKKKLK